MVDQQPPTEDRGLSMWAIVAVLGAAVILAGVAVLLAARSGTDPELGASASTTTTSPPVTTSTTRASTTTTVSTTASVPSTTTTLGGDEDFNRVPNDFLLKQGTPVAELSSFVGTATLEMSVGDFHLTQESTGIWVGDAYECTTATSFGGLEAEAHVVATAGRTWLDRAGRMFRTVEWDSDVQTALSSCPAYPGFWFDFEMPAGLSSNETDTVNGIPVTIVNTGELANLILGNEPGAIEIQESSFYLADSGGWLVGMDVGLEIDGNQASDIFGLPGGDSLQPATVRMSVRISDPNNPELTVALPPPSFPFFRGDEELVTVGEARIDEDQKLLRLTKSTNAVVAAAAWFARKQPVGDGFDTNFVFRMTDIGPNPGEGLAFVIQNHQPDAMGIGASGIGYKEMPNSVAIEFDTVFQDYESDANSNHIAVHTLGTDPNTAHATARLGSANIPYLMANDGTHVVRISYVPGELNVFLDDLDEPRLTVAVDLATKLRLDDGNAWVGFTASTAPGFRQSNDIMNWFFIPGPPEE